MTQPSETWNGELGLWTVRRPDGSVLHSGPATADQLLAAAILRHLEPDQLLAALAGLQRLQVSETCARHGNFRQYYEDKDVLDLSAGSRIVLRLIALRTLAGRSIEAEVTPRIDELLSHFDLWVRSSLNRRSHFVPGRYLGDLACGWLTAEIQNRGDAARIEGALTTMGRYCENHHWGNGDHLGETASARCIDALSILLILAKKLPDALRSRWCGLLNEIVRIDDAYGPVPRLPALGVTPGETKRSSTYRDRVASPAPTHGLFLFLKENGWSKLAPPESEPRRQLSIPCFGGVNAVLQSDSNARLGSFEKFPLILSSERESSGLSWQSFPICFQHDEGDFGYFQWETLEGKTLAQHPATAVEAGTRALTASVSPPVCGHTHSIQKEFDAIVLRILPAIVSSWDQVIDRFQISNFHGKPKLETMRGMAQLQLGYGKKLLSISSFELPGMAVPKLFAELGDRLHWDVVYGREALVKRRMLVHLWAISFGKSSAWLPAIVPFPDHDVPRRPEEEAYDFRWKSPTRNWHLVIDPLSEKPLREV